MSRASRASHTSCQDGSSGLIQAMWLRESWERASPSLPLFHLVVELSGQLTPKSPTLSLQFCLSIKWFSCSTMLTAFSLNQGSFALIVLHITGPNSSWDGLNQEKFDFASSLSIHSQYHLLNCYFSISSPNLFLSTQTNISKFELLLELTSCRFPISIYEAIHEKINEIEPFQVMNYYIRTLPYFMDAYLLMEVWGELNQLDDLTLNNCDNS